MPKEVLSFSVDVIDPQQDGKIMGHASTERNSKREHIRKATSAIFLKMDSQPRVSEVEWREEGVEVHFEDGRKGLFPTELLYANLPAQ